MTTARDHQHSHRRFHQHQEEEQLIGGMKFRTCQCKAESQREPDHS